MTYEGTPLSILEGVFAMEDDQYFPLKTENSTELNRFTKTFDNSSNTDINYESISERRNRRKPRPMPHTEFSLNSMLNLDTPYRHKSVDLPDDNANITTTGHHDDDDIEKISKSIQSESSSDCVCDFKGCSKVEENDVKVKESESSESQICYGNENVVTYLKSEYIRWFYKYEAEREWTAFTGYDSTRLESKYRQRQKEIKNNSKLDENIMGGVQGQGSSTENQEKKVTLVNKNYFQSNESSINTKRERSGSKNWFSSWMDGDDDDLFVNADEITPDETNPGGVTKGENGTSMKQIDNLVFVRGGLYEANVDVLTCTATYWPADSTDITRGTWFYDGTWQPIPSDQADLLEEHHLGKFGGTTLNIPITISPEPKQPDSPTRTTKPVLHRVSFTDFHVDWTSPTEIHLYSKAASYQFMRSVGQRLGFQTWGHRLCRGYMKPASLSDRPCEISHVVFVVHGIGQKMDTGRIVRNCATFRECVANMRSRYFPQQLGSRQRAEFFPVEWRSFAKLDGDIVDAITPNKLLTLRQLLNATAMDIMYYTSPLYRTEIQDALMSELNRIYTNFVKRNPNFEARGGKISILAHSLGAVITYDIITGYRFEYEPRLPVGSIDVISTSTEEINHEGIIVIDDVAGVPVSKQPKGLQFKLEHFFCLGSPLAVFLALRWREPHNPELRSFILPHHLCKRIYNVFHPSDPVAYRLEPLLNQAYRGIAPLCINSYNAMVQAKYEQMSKEAISREYYCFEKGGENIFGVSIHEDGLPQELQQLEQQNTQPRVNPFTALKSPPTNSKEFGRGWWNLIKYWKIPGTGSDFGQNTSGIHDDFTQTEEMTAESLNLISPFVENAQVGTSEAKPETEPDKIEDDLDYRMDFVLRESNLSSSYLAAITSHTSYWGSPEVAFFVLTHLHNGPLDLRQDNTA